MFFLVLQVMNQHYVKKTMFMGTIRSLAVPREGEVDVELSNGKVYRIKAYQVSLGLMRVPSNTYFLVRKIFLAVFAALIVIFIIAQYTLGPSAAQYILYTYMVTIASFIVASMVSLRRSRPVDVVVIYGFDGIRYIFRIEEGRLDEIREAVEKATKTVRRSMSKR